MDKFTCVSILRKTCCTVIVENPPLELYNTLMKLAGISFAYFNDSNRHFTFVIPLGNDFSILWNNLTQNCEHELVTEFKK